jgi:hypothetical protein
MFWRAFCDFFNFSGTDSSGPSAPAATVVNPATGLPMLDDSIGGVDAGGSPFGSDIHQSWDSMGSSDFNHHD